jgi:hypothetical protein
MRVYTVHEPPGELTPEARAERAAFVKEGFCWPALFIAPIWLLYHRMAWGFLGYLVLSLLMGALVARLPAGAGSALSFLFAVWFALEANALRRWSLARRNWRMVGVAAGRTQDEAERAFFRQDTEPRKAAARPSAGAGTGRLAETDVIGLFPERGR